MKSGRYGGRRKMRKGRRSRGGAYKVGSSVFARVFAVAYLRVVSDREQREEVR